MSNTNYKDRQCHCNVYCCVVVAAAVSLPVVVYSVIFLKNYKKEFRFCQLGSSM